MSLNEVDKEDTLEVLKIKLQLILEINTKEILEIKRGGKNIEIMKILFISRCPL